MTRLPHSITAFCLHVVMLAVFAVQAPAWANPSSAVGEYGDGAIRTNAPQTLRIASEGAYPPFNYTDENGALKGFEIAFAMALCDRMQVQCVFVAQDWAGMIDGLLAHKYDAILASMSMTEERRKRVAFSHRYYQTPSRFMARRSLAINSTAPIDLAGMKIGAQLETTHTDFLAAHYKYSQVFLYQTLDEAALDLASGKLDLVMADAIALYEWLTKTEDGGCCHVVGEKYDDPAYFGDGIGIALRPGDESLREAFNTALDEILADGTYDTINARYFPFSIY